MQTMPIKIISSPPQYTRGNPTIHARQVVVAMAFFMESSFTHPIAQARRGPRRVSTSSVPLAKSKKSLMKLASICMMKAKRRHNPAATQLNTPSPYISSSTYANDTPIITGTAAPDNVLGRAAKSQAFMELVSILFSSIIFSTIFVQIYIIFVNYGWGMMFFSYICIKIQTFL